MNDAVFEWIELAAIALGPVVAVVITLVWERVRRKEERRSQLLQTLMSLRATPGNPWFTNAINTIPLEFSNDSEVLLARRDCLELNLAPEEVARRQDKLIWTIMRAMSIKVPAAPTQSELYYATGLGRQEQLLEKALQSLPYIAASSMRSADASERMLASILATADQGRATSTPLDDR